MSRGDKAKAKEQRKKRRAANMERERAYRRAYYAANKERVLARNKRRRDRPEVKVARREKDNAWRRGRAGLERILKRARYVRRQYGLGPEEYRQRLERQVYTCPICMSPLEDGRICVDHDHATLAVRGLLCAACNSVLGLAKDNVVILKRAIEYLELLGGGVVAAPAERAEGQNG